MGAPNEYLLRLIITQGLRRWLPPQITGSKNGGNIFILEAAKSGAFSLDADHIGSLCGNHCLQQRFYDQKTEIKEP